MVKWKIFAILGLSVGVLGVGWGYAQQRNVPGFYELRIYKAVHVERDLPGTIRIVVTEHEAVAFVRRDDNKVALLSNEGRVIADVASPPPGTIEVRGVRKAPAIGRLLSPPEAAGVVRTLPAQLANQVVAINVAGEGVALELTRGGEVRLGTLDDVDAKSAAALAVLKTWGDKPLSYIDVSVPQAPTAR